MRTKYVNKTWLFVLILGLLALGGAFAGYRGYMSARQNRLIKQARKFLSRSDATRAQLALRNALAHNPKDLDACRLMAQLAEASHSASALLWRGRALEINPRSLEDRLKLAHVASLLRDFAAAQRALDGALPDQKKTAAFQNAAGEVAAAAGHYAEAEAHFLQAAQIDPANLDTQLSLAIARLQGTNAADLAQARSALKRMSANPAMSCQALRVLAMDALRWKQTGAALALSKELLRQTNAVFKDQLLRLDVLRAARDAGFAPALAACQRQAALATTNSFDLASWEMANGSVPGALAWLRSLPKPAQTNQPIALLVAECAMKSGDSAGLQAFLEKQNWAELEFVRHAYQAWALRGQNLEGSSKAQWEEAFKMAAPQKDELSMLLRLAVQFQWQDEQEDVLWHLVNNFPTEKWPAQVLAEDLLRHGRTRSLLHLFSEESKRRPADLAAKNNMAMTALLLGAQEANPQALALQVYQQQPTNADYASTYALALYLRTNSVEALKVLERLSPRELEDPSISGCYGMVLSATGQPAKARKYLDRTSRAILLPEERQLIDRARAGI